MTTRAPLEKGKANMHGRGTLAVAALICAIVMALGAPSALAQGPTQQGYDETNILGNIQSEGTPPKRPPPPSTNQATPKREEESLPFTGLDLGVLALMGVVLLGTGVAIKRTTRSNPA